MDKDLKEGHPVGLLMVDAQCHICTINLNDTRRLLVNALTSNSFDYVKIFIR
jgi:hypothetical protein